MYSTITRSIRVSVEPVFLEEQSSPPDDHYVWAYQVKIENDGEETVQLVNRHWQITDAQGRMQEVQKFRAKAWLAINLLSNQGRHLNIPVERRLERPPA
jgi:hypothetical protein